jgi:hypothetical protein
MTKRRRTDCYPSDFHSRAKDAIGKRHCLAMRKCFRGGIAMTTRIQIIAFGTALVFAFSASTARSQDAQKAVPPAAQQTTSSQVAKTPAPPSIPLTREACQSACQLGKSKTALSGDDAAFFNACADAGKCSAPFTTKLVDQPNDNVTKQGSVLDYLNLNFLKRWWTS